MFRYNDSAMTTLVPKSTITRRGLSAALALAVLAVQFGLVQHSIEAAPGHLHEVCGYCITADHQPPVPAASAIPIATPVISTATVAVVPSTPYAPLRAAHQVRAPPAIA